MRVLVTGATGYVGKEAVKSLALRGHEVVPYDLRQGQDILDRDRLTDAMRGCEAVVHLAAIPHPDPNKHWEAYWRVNVAGTQQVAEVAAGLGIGRFVYASSTAYYGAHRGFAFDPGDGVAEEDDNAVQRYGKAWLPEMAPYNEAALAYACSKVAAETALAAYGMSGRLDVVILRLCPLIKTRTPYEWGLLLFVEDAGAAVAGAVELPGSGYDIYNVAGEGVAALNTERWQECNHGFN